MHIVEKQFTKVMITRISFLSEEWKWNAMTKHTNAFLLCVEYFYSVCSVFAFLFAYYYRYIFISYFVIWFVFYLICFQN